jgi:hypothetical protein
MRGKNIPRFQDSKFRDPKYKKFRKPESNPSGYPNQFALDIGTWNLGTWNGILDF